MLKVAVKVYFVNIFISLPAGDAQPNDVSKQQVGPIGGYNCVDRGMDALRKQGFEEAGMRRGSNEDELI